MRENTEPSGAVAEMLAAEHAEREFGSSGEIVISAPEPAPEPPPVPRIPPPDWDQEARERAERERLEREAEASPPEVENVESLEARTAMCSKPKATKPTPRLDRVRAWLEGEKP